MRSLVLDRRPWIEPVLLCLAAPLLLFPRGPLPLVGLATILAIWLARMFRQQGMGPTHLDLPLLILLAMAAQSIYPSVDPSLSMPKLYGIVLGVAAYYGVVRFATSPRRWWMVAAGLMVAAVAIAAVGLVGTAWITFKLPGGAALYSRIPRLISSVPSSLGTITGIHPNELGGTLAFLLPLPLGLALWSIGRKRSVWGGAARPSSRALHSPVSAPPIHPRTDSFPHPLATSLLALLLAGPVLVLTQSRSGMAGFAVAVALLAGMRWRKVGYGIASLIVVGGLVAGVVGSQQGIVSSVSQLDYVGDAGAKLVGRQEIWSRAVYMIQDFPFTGIGLNTFPIVLDNLYPSFLTGPDARIPHAHDIYLQTAVDLGLAGLMAFVGLWLIVGWQAVLAFRNASDVLTKGAIAGLAAGCVAYLVYGITDAITLGAKPLVLLWVAAGLLVAAARRRDGAWTGQRAGPRERQGAGESGGVDDSNFGSLLSSQHSALSTPPLPQHPTPNTQHARRSSLLPRLRPIAAEVGRTLWMTYWMIAVLFAVLAFVVDGIAISGWVP
jgi:putative inorganic carbon (hco3(-)) transporter